MLAVEASEVAVRHLYRRGALEVRLVFELEEVLSLLLEASARAVPATLAAAALAALSPAM